jgi:hypothetical protein
MGLYGSKVMRFLSLYQELFTFYMNSHTKTQVNLQGGNNNWRVCEFVVILRVIIRCAQSDINRRRNPA